jgi:hypothetical protein
MKIVYGGVVIDGMEGFIPHNSSDNYCSFKDKDGTWVHIKTSVIFRIRELMKVHFEKNKAETTYENCDFEIYEQDIVKEG